MYNSNWNKILTKTPEETKNPETLGIQKLKTNY